MPRKVTPEPVAVPEPEIQWTPEQLLAVRHLGPGVIGEAMYRAKEAYIASSAGGILGPATRG